MFTLILKIVIVDASHRQLDIRNWLLITFEIVTSFLGKNHCFEAFILAYSAMIKVKAIPRHKF